MSSILKCLLYFILTDISAILLKKSMRKKTKSKKPNEKNKKNQNIMRKMKKTMRKKQKLQKTFLKKI